MNARWRFAATSPTSRQPVKSPLCKALLILALSAATQSAELTSSGDWVATINAANLVSGAGSDLQAQFESVSGVTTLTITNAPGAWSLRVRRSGSQWHGNVTAHVKRTSDGSGSGSISGGNAYAALAATDTELFSGSGARGNISLQFKLTGLSKTVSPATYLSSIIFTVQ